LLFSKAQEKHLIIFIKKIDSIELSLAR